MSDTRKNGATSNIVRLKLLKASTGLGYTGLTSASTGLIISTIADVEASATAYTVAGSTIETITTLGTFAAPTATKCRFKEVDATNHKGLYEFQFADARFAVSSAKKLVISVSGVPDMLETDYEIQLVSFDPNDTVRLGLTALPNAAAEAAGGLYTRGTGAGQINQPANGMVDINAVRLLGTAISTPATAGILDVNVKNIDNDAASASGTVTFPNATLASTTNITAGTVTTATNVTTVNGLAAGVITAASIAADAITDAKVASDVTIASVTGAVGSVTGAVGSVTAGVTVSTNNDKTGYGLSSAAVQAIWDALTSALTTAGSIGKYLLDHVVGTLAAGTHTAQSGDTYARLGAPAGASVSADVASIKTDTGTTLPARLPAALVSGRMDASVGAMAANVVTAAAIADAALDRATFAADTGMQTTRSNTCQAGSTATTCVLDAAASAVTDFYVGAWVMLTGGTGAGQTRLCTAYNGTTKTATITPAWATTPDNTSTFAILGVAGLGTLPSAERNAIADALLDRTDAIETGLTPRGQMRLVAAAEAGKASGLATTTVTIRNAVADSKARITATVDANGNRTAVTTDVT